MGFLAARFRLWQKSEVWAKSDQDLDSDIGFGGGRWNRMSHDSKTCTKEYTGLQKKLQAIITKSSGWRTLLKGRRFGLAGALHYMACAHTTSNAVKQLAKLRCDDILDFTREEYSRKLVERVVACQQERQARAGASVPLQEALLDGS